ncbi:DNA-binding protein [Paraburkholderia tuberum]|uniref:Replication region DNA-binding N-term n=1 Tax=Paraburkholderia tuberum TaxID=157910 RepID=A0A1H1KKC3_9BURK|nr:DNA-binding protein [Paraburkholderia tuberum]SDR62522.1 replication region DNA-binding N-term [Paraburkholderia tuberum]
MGREATITAEQVNAIVDAMKIEGIKPTSRAVRERLGNTGSMGTINKLLQQRKAGQARQATAVLTLPPALQKALIDFMDAELTAARATLEAELAEQQQEAADLATENERQAELIAARDEELEALAIEKAEAEGKAGQLSADLDTARDEATRERHAAELARTELAKAQLRLEAMPRLEGDLAAVRGELDTERQARVAAEQSAAVLAAQKDDLTARLIDVGSRRERTEEMLSAQQQRNDKLSTELADTRASLQATEARAKAFEREVATATADAERARAAAKTAGEQAAQLRGQFEASRPAQPARKRSTE